VHSATVGRVRRAFVEEGLAAALERKAPSRTYTRTPTKKGGACSRWASLGGPVT